MKIKATGNIVNGVLKIFNRDVFLGQIESAPDGLYQLSLSKKFKQRSNLQNAYYWGVTIQCFINGYKEMNGVSITSEMAHEFLKKEFNHDELVNPNTGEVKTIGMSTSDLPTIGFMEYVSDCNNFIFEWFNITVPEPEEQTELKF